MVSVVMEIFMSKCEVIILVGMEVVYEKIGYVLVIKVGDIVYVFG